MPSVESIAKPFLKWAGGKAKLVPKIIAHIPSTWNPETDLYIEPFLGGGAMFFALRPKHALLNDANARLMRTYWAIANEVEKVISLLYDYEVEHSKHGSRFYYRIRDSFRDEADDSQLAADFIFLNKAGFNGLYRVNRKGRFNVPWGKRKDVALYESEESLRLCSSALQGATLLACSFEACPWNGWIAPLIYCDPPYVPVSKTADFTAYTPGGFDYADQLRLVAQATRWKQAGAHVILSQAADEMLLEQYVRCGFKYEIVEARRNINSKGGSRGPVQECIIY